MANFPLTLDTPDSLYNVADLASDDLAANLNSGVLSFDLTDGSEFPTGRQIVSINNEIIIVSSRTGNTFTVETRGAFGTTDDNHLATDAVNGNYTAGHYDVIRDTIIAMQANLQWYRQPVSDSQVDDPGTLAVPTVGDRYAIPGPQNPSPGIGAWAANHGDIAIFNGSDLVTYGTNAGAWDFIDVTQGTLAFANELVTTGGLQPRLAIQVFDSWFGLNDIPASQINYSNGASGLTATNVQDAIDEIDATLDNHGIDSVLALAQALTADRLISGAGFRFDVQTSDAGGSTQLNVDTSFARMLSTGIGTTSNLTVSTAQISNAFTDGTVGVNTLMNATQYYAQYDDGVNDVTALRLASNQARLEADNGGDLHYFEASSAGLAMQFDLGPLRINGATGALGEVLTSQGPGNPPQWGFVSIPTPGIDDVLAVGQTLTAFRTIDGNGNSFRVTTASGPQNASATVTTGGVTLLAQNAISQGLITCSPGQAQISADFGGNTVGVTAFNGGLDFVLDQGAIFVDGVAGNVGEFLQSQGNSAAPIWSVVPAPGIDDVLAVGQQLTAPRVLDANQQTFEIANNNGAGTISRILSSTTFASLESSDGVTNSTMSVGGATVALATVGAQVNLLLLQQTGIGLTLGPASDLTINGVPGNAGDALISNGNNAPPSWGLPARPVFQSENTDIATNLNTAALTQVPIMGNVTQAGPAGLFTVAANLVTVNSDAKIKVSWNINLEGGLARNNVGTRCLLNGAAIGPRGGSAYIRISGGHNEASSHGSYILDVSAGDTIGVGAQQLAAGGTTTMAVAGLSNIMIEVLELT